MRGSGVIRTRFLERGGDEFLAVLGARVMNWSSDWVFGLCSESGVGLVLSAVFRMVESDSARAYFSGKTRISETRATWSVSSFLTSSPMRLRRPRRRRRRWR